MTWKQLHFAKSSPLFLFTSRLALILLLVFAVSDSGYGQTYGLLKKIFAPDGAIDDGYGYSVAVDDSIAVVGAPFDNGSGSTTGAVYVYFRNQGGPDNWGFVAKITPTPSGGDEDALFGSAVAVSDSVIIVGAPGDNQPDQGAAYIYYRNQGGPNNYGEVAKIFSSDLSSGDEFGFSVSISDTIAVVGARNGGNGGKAYVFYKNQGGADNWGEAQDILANTNQSQAEFGFSVDVESTRLIVGAPLYNGGDSDEGRAFIYEKDNGGIDNWGNVAILIPSDAEQDAQFGTSVTIDGDNAAAGAPLDDDPVNGVNSGSAYLFSADQGGIGNWGEVVKVAGSSTAQDDEFGRCVALSDSLLLVGAPEDDDSGLSSGAAFLFLQDQGGTDNWGETQRLNGFDAVAGDRFGFSCQIFGDFLYIGSPDDDDSGINSGSVYIYEEAAVVCDFPTVECDSITVYLNEQGLAVISPQDINAGATTSCGITSFSLSQSVFDCSDIGDIAVTLTVVDIAGNIAECTGLVTVEDTLAPFFVNCPVDTLTVTNNVDQCAGNVIWSIPVAEDNCGIDSVVQTAGPMPGTQLPLGVHEIQYVSYDPQLLTDTCTFYIEVVDSQAPFLACPPDLTFDNDPGQCDWTSTPGQLDPLIAIDNCAPVLNYTITTSTGAMSSDSGAVGMFDFPVGVNTVCYMIMDSAGTQFDTCCFTITVNDVEAPVVDCPMDASIGTDEGVCEAAYTWTHPVPTDNCAVDSMTVSIMFADGSSASSTVDPADYGTDVMDVFPEGVNSIVYVVFDTSGNMSSCFFNVTVFDDESPSVVCPADVTIQTSDGGIGDCAGELTFTHPVPTDNCEVASFTLQIVNPDGTIEGPYEVMGGGMQTRDFQLGVSGLTYVAVDGNGNVFSCQYFVTVVDDEDPEFITCPADTITIGSDVDVCGAFVNWPIPIAEDNCGVDSVVQIGGPAQGDSLAPGFYTITYVAYDGATPANTDTCEFVINVVDTQFPLIQCPSNNVVVSTDPGVCTWTPPAGSLSPTVAIANCPFEITWEVYQDDILQASGVDDVSGNYTFNLDTSVVCYYITETSDPDGNGLLTDTCCFLVIVQDTEPPVIACPSDVTFLDTDDGVEDCQHTMGSNALDALAIDNCSVVSLTHDYPSVSNTTLAGAVFPVGSTVITWTAVDTAGNESSCSFTVVVEDNVPPSITCPDDVTIQTTTGGAGPDECVGELEWTHPTPTDNCNIVEYTVTYTNPDGSMEGPYDLLNPPVTMGDRQFPVGVSVVTYYVEDSTGNTNGCSFNVTVEDNEDPIFVNCPDTLTFSNDPSLCGAFVNWPEPVAVDNCNDTLNVVQTGGPASGSFIAVGDPVDITYQATDDQGNSAECVFTIVVEDNENPTAVCQDTVVYVDADGNASILADDIDGGSTDNCGIDTITATPVAFTCADIGDNNVLLTVTDLSGNISACVAEVTVLDTIPPSFECPADSMISVCEQIVPDFISGLAGTDNCSDVTFMQDPLPGVTFFVAVGDTFQVNIVATDSSGNTSSCVVNLIIFDEVCSVACINDVEPPEWINCPRPPINVETPPGMCDAFVNFSLPIAVDSCEVDTIIQVDTTGLTTGDQFPVGLTILKWIAIDTEGNISDTCRIKIFVNDTEPPQLLCPDDTTAMNALGGCGATIEGISPIVLDNCLTAVTWKVVDTTKGFGIIAGGGDDISGEEFGCGTFEVTYRVSDQNVLLLSEVTHELEALNGGTNPVPPFIQTTNGDDFVEITNYGPTSMDISCLTIERIGGNNEVFVVPDGVILAVGDVFTLHYGDGTDSPADFFYNVPGAADLAQGTPAGYVISVDTVAMDVVAVNGLDPVGAAQMSTVLPTDWDGSIDMSDGGSAYRLWPWDENSELDWAVADLCMPATIGSLNPNTNLLADIGTTTSLQSLPPNTAECVFFVTLEDTELPECGDLSTFTYEGEGNEIGPSSIVQTIINVPDNFEVYDVNVLDLVGSAPDMSFLTFKLQSPEGNSVLLFQDECPNQPDFDLNLDSEDTVSVVDAPCGPLGAGGTFAPEGDLNDLNGDMAQGPWILIIANADPENTAILESWTLEIGEASPYSQTDTIIPNDPGMCGAEFTWTHPVVIDNCGEGDVFVEYSSEDGINVPSGGQVIPGSEVTEFFEVGTTTVTYTITDKAGNTNQCSFDVTVEDVEIPVLLCPDDIFINLGPGECAAVTTILPEIVGDNCALDSVIIDPPFGTSFPIGTTVVTIIAFDEAGNSDTCTLNVTVIEFVPMDESLTCNDLVNLSLDATCTYEIGADAILEGSDYGCYDDFCISALDENGDTIPDNILTLDHVGQTITVIIAECEDPQNSCWGQIFVEDKLVPEVECPADITVACNESTDTSITGVPTVLSCELQTTITYEDNFVENDECGDPRILITRTWFVTDESGNVGTCEQQIAVMSYDPSMLEFPPHFTGDMAFSCEEVNADPTLTEPENTGFPTINGQSIFGDHFCEVNVGYWDEFLQDANCPGSYELLRNWVLRDECEPLEPGVNPVRYIQSIMVKDRNAPVLNASVQSDPSQASTSECIGFVYLDAEPYDACTQFTGVSWKILYTENGATQIVATGELPLNGFAFLELGRSYWAVFQAEDGCHNVASDTVYFDLPDEVPPTAICDEHTIVSLGEDPDFDRGLTKLTAESLDDGSFDNCGPVTFLARRMTGCIDFDWTGPVPDQPDGIVNATDRGQTYQPLVPFSCCDIGQGAVMVELLVTDENGYSNTCMVEVEVQDKLRPFLECPPDIEVSCEFWFDVQETNGFVDQSEDVTTPIFGRVLDAFEYDESDREVIIIDDPGNDQLPQPYVWGIDGWADDNCDVDITVRVRVFDDCSGEDLPGVPPSPYATRLIERTFRADDGSTQPRTCVQRIWIIDFEPFYISDETCVNSDPNDGVIWPCDEEYNTCPDELPVNYPTVFDDNCSLIGVTYEDARFNFVDGACYKILRTWTVIDWCQHDVITGAGIWEYTQVIKVIDNQPAAFEDCPTEPVTLCVADSNVYLPENNQVFLGEDDPDASSCSAHVILEHTVTETCSDHVIYDVKLYPFDGTDFIQVVSETEVQTDTANEAVLTFSSEFASLPSNHPIRTDGVPYNSPYCSNWPLPGGDKDYHRILWTVEDGCGNLSTCEYLFRLEDCKQPSPVCVGLSSVVMPTSGEVTIWAVDFNASSFDDCTPADDLLYSFTGDSYEPSRVFDCDAIAENGSPSFLIEIWVADEGNDQDCNGEITWDERNKDFCTTFIVIDDNEGVCPTDGTIGGIILTEEEDPVIDVNVNLMDPTGDMMESFVTSGDGTYFFINPLLSYSIEPKRNDDHMNGVSTLDLIKIQKHLLGQDLLESPYLLIAADANNSESVSAIDLVVIRKLILGLYPEFPENQSWRFVDAGFDFSDPTSPWPFDEVIHVANAFSMNEDFVAVKIGDVNGSVVANANSIETRQTAGSLIFQTEDREVTAGDEVAVPVRASAFADIMGYQFTLRTEGLDLTAVQPGELDMTSENVAVHESMVTASWHKAAPVTADDVLFTLEFTATRNGMLSEMMGMNSRITVAEAYNGSEDLLDVSMIFCEDCNSDDPKKTVEYALFQNEPNPVFDKTVIGFTLPEEMDATLTIFDAAGKVVRIIEGSYNSGFNAVEIRKDELNNAGMLYYRLDAQDFSATKKMIIVE